MGLIKKVLSYFNGLHYPQDYLCLANESFQPRLHAYLVVNRRVVKDITALHLFNGYCPLLFTFSSSSISHEIFGERIEIFFTHESFKPNEYLPPKVALAGLSLKRVHKQAADGIMLFFYEGLHGWHRFTSGLQQLTGQLYNRLYNRKPGNVFLKGNLHKQVQIAYAIPRKICLITVSDGDLYNLFPTDLHGAVNDNLYVISLRHEGKACSQVEAAGKMVISDMDATTFKTVFGLGKNHTQSMKERTAFEFTAKDSKHFHLPLPKGLLAYKELQLFSSFTHGIHKLLIFKIIYKEQVNPAGGTLAHIHNSYATWRYKKGFESNYLMR